MKSTAYEKPTTVSELSELYDPEGFRKDDPGEAAEEKIKSPGGIAADWHKVYKDAGLDVEEDQAAVKGHLLRGFRQMRGGLDLIAQGLQTVEMAVACTPAEELTNVLKELFPQKQPEPAKDVSTPGQIISQVSSLVRDVAGPQQQQAASAEAPAAPAFMRTRKTTKRVQAGELSITHIPKRRWRHFQTPQAVQESGPVLICVRWQHTGPIHRVTSKLSAVTSGSFMMVSL